MVPAIAFRTAAMMLAAVSSTGCALHRPAPVVGSPRVIVLSIDSFNEERALQSLPAESTPAIRAVVAGGACAPARPAFPSLTSPGHAALWTGAYGDVSGIAGNVQSRLPVDAHSLAETTSGFDGANLRAEPLWVTATLAGLTSIGHHATHSPAVPGFPPAHSARPEPEMARLRARADSARRSGRLHQVNGYDDELSRDLVVTHATAEPRDAPAWRGLSGHAGDGSSVRPREVAIPFGAAGDSLFILFTGRAGRYDRVLVGRSRDAGNAVVAHATPAESSPIAGRELARHFSAPLVVRSGERTARIRVRLFDLAPDGSRYLLFIPAASVTAASSTQLREGYDQATGGWVGNSASGLLGSGALGATLASGGDGTAERRWLETAELATATSIAGARWMWDAYRPHLMADYFAIGDDTDHLFWGLATAPAVDDSLARAVQRVRAHAWSLVDARIGAVHEMARAAGATFILTGDHGMRAYWRLFRPNVALARAGLLATDSAGRPVLSRSRALSPNGYWVTVNRTMRREGIVRDDDVATVIDSIASVLAAVRGPDGGPVVTRIYKAGMADSLGLGGPAGGDVYFELAPGYYYNAGFTGDVTSATTPRGGHGYPSVGDDMQTVVCMTGPGIARRRGTAARLIDVAPTVLDILGIPPAGAMRGQSLLDRRAGRRISNHQAGRR